MLRRPDPVTRAGQKVLVAPGNCVQSNTPVSASSKPENHPVQPDAVVLLHHGFK